MSVSSIWVKDGEELLNYLDACDKFDNSPEKNPA